MIDLYYTFDEPVIREILGRKLSGKDRKDLDDVSEKHNLSIKSCRRQFDNIKRILKVVDDFEGSLVDNVKKRFCIKESMAQSYALLVFMCHNRFETGKKKLTHLSVADFTSCANFMIQRWTSRSGESRNLVDDDLELDRDFLHELHDLKLNLIDRVWIDHHQKYIMRDLKRKHCPYWLLRSVETNFKMFSRNLTTMGASLIHSKDLKDFFIDIVEKLIDPAQALKWSREDMDVLFTSMIETFSDCETNHVGQLGRFTNKDRTRWADTYLRYLEVMKHCAIALYHN